MVEEFLRTEAKKILHKYRCTRTSDCQLCFSQLKCVCVNNLKNVLEAAMNTLFIPILNTEKRPFFFFKHFPYSLPFFLFFCFLCFYGYVHTYTGIFWNLRFSVFFFFKNPVHMWYSLSTLPDVFVDVRCLLDCGTGLILSYWSYPLRLAYSFRVLELLWKPPCRVRSFLFLMSVASISYVGQLI